MYSEYRMPNHNNKHTRKNNNKQSKPVDPPKMDPSVTVVDDDDDGFGCIFVKNTPRNTTRSNKKKQPEPKPAPIPEPIPEWEQVGMTKEEYEALRQRVAKEMMDSQIENFKQAMLADLDSISFWEDRIESLERSRERYNKKRGWSADDLAAVEEIDAEIKECENEIARIESYDDFDNTDLGVLLY